MDTAANQIDELLGPEPVIEEVSQEETVAPVEEKLEQATESDLLTPEENKPAEPAQVETKQTPEQIAENYKRMAHAERMERKQIAEQMKTMQSRFEQLMAAVTPKQDVIPEPVYEDDPLGSTHAKVDKIAQSVESIQAENARRQQQEQFQGFVSNIQADEAKFMEKSPDYKEAVAYIQQRRLKELEVMGYPEDQAMRVLAQDAYAVTQRAIAIGESPAQFAYNMAKQLGYMPKQASNIENIAAGQAVAKSVAGGAQPVSEGSLPNNLAEMSDAEFDALFAKLAKS